MKKILKVVIWPFVKSFGLIVVVVGAGIAAMLLLGNKSPEKNDGTEEQHEIVELEAEKIEIVEAIVKTEQQAAEITETIEENTTTTENKIDEVMSNETSETDDSVDATIDTFFDTWD